MAVSSAASRRTRTDGGTKSLEVVVIGAGMSGILMGVKLREAGITDFVILEKADRLGGTWRENTYPGIACDVPSHHYVYSFERNPDWSHRFPPGSEIRAYFERAAEKYGLTSHIRFGWEVDTLDWDGTHWRVATKDGETLTAGVVVSATGVLHHPAWPDIEGLDSFRGIAFHTARWRHDVELAGKRVGIIGTGSTAAQVIPSIAGEVGRLSVFQRTPQWILPLPDREYSRFGKALLRRVPLLMRGLYRWYELLLERYFSEVVIGKRSADFLEKRCRANLATVKDAALRAKLTPSYSPGCKRLIVSSAFYPAMQRANVELVTERILRIEPEGVRTADGVLHELDVLVLSTGFHADRFLRPIRVHGEAGIDIEDIWKDGPQAYRSIAVPKMPNLFLLIGPHSPIGNLSLIAIAESQASAVLRCLDRIRSQKVAICPSVEAVRRLQQEMREASRKTVWVSGCKSWYLDKDGSPALYPWEPSRFYGEMQRQPLWSDFDVKPLARPGLDVAA